MDRPEIRVYHDWFFPRGSPVILSENIFLLNFTSQGRVIFESSIRVSDATIITGWEEFLRSILIFSSAMRAVL
jgi:hypothetical protein